MDQGEFEELQAAHRAAIEGIIDFRSRRNATLDEVPFADFHHPVQLIYQRLSRDAGLEAPIVEFEHLLDHAAERFGPPCRGCGRPLRTPKAKLCAECGLEL